MRSATLRKPAGALAGLMLAMLMLPSAAMAGGWAIDPASTVHTSGMGEPGQDGQSNNNLGTDEAFTGTKIINNTDGVGYDPSAPYDMYNGVDAFSAINVNNVRYRWDGSDGSIPDSDFGFTFLRTSDGTDWVLVPTLKPWVITVRGNMIAQLGDAGTASGAGTSPDAFTHQERKSTGNLFQKGLYRESNAGYTSSVVSVRAVAVPVGFLFYRILYYLDVPQVLVTAVAGAYSNGSSNNAWAFAAVWLDAPRVATAEDVTPNGPDTPPTYPYSPGPGGDTEPSEPGNGDPGGGYNFSGDTGGGGYGGGNSGGGTDF